MALMNVNDCYKKGLFGTTIFDVSNKINSVDDVISWLEYMYNLATYTTEGKSEHKGMRRLLDVIEKNRVLELKYDSTELSVKIKAIGALVTSLNFIEEGSKKAWVGRTKQKGFQNTLKTCQKVARQALDEVKKKLNDKVSNNNAIIKTIVTNVQEIKTDIVKKSSDINKVEKQANTEILKSIENQNIKINNKEKEKIIEIIEKNDIVDNATINKIEIVLDKKMEENKEQKKALTIPDAKNLPPFTWLVKLWNNIDKISKDKKDNDFDEASKGIIEKLPEICKEIFTKPTNDNVDLTKVPNDNVYYAKDLCALLGALKKLRDQIKPGLNKEFDNNLDNCIEEINRQLDSTKNTMLNKMNSLLDTPAQKMIGPLSTIDLIQKNLTKYSYDNYVDEILKNEERWIRWYCYDDKVKKDKKSVYLSITKSYWSPEKPSVADQNWTKPSKIKLSYK